MERAQGGDVSAFEALVRHTHPTVFGVCRQICGNNADAEDAAQDTFVRAWRALPGFRGDSSVVTWLARIATNVSLTLVSKRRDVVTDEVPETADLRESPELAAEGLARLGVVRSALGELSADARAAFVLRDVQGLTYEEIAETLGITLPAVKSRIFRARQAVAAALAAHDRGERR